MAIETKDLVNAEQPSADHISGRIANENPLGAENGTPVNREAISDLMETAMKNAREAGIVFNGLPDNETNGYQLSEAIDRRNGLNLKDVGPMRLADGAINVSPEAATPQGIRFNNDGTKLFIINNSFRRIVEYELSEAFDISTASYTQHDSIFSQDSEPEGVAFNADGTKMFISGSTNDAIYEYDLSAAFDISTIAHSQTLNIAGGGNIVRGLSFNASGTKMRVCESNNDVILEYDLSTGFDISTAQLNYTLDVSALGAALNDVWVNKAGTLMYVATGNGIHVYELNGIDTIEGAIYLKSRFLEFNNSPRGICFNANEDQIIICVTNNFIEGFNLGKGINADSLYAEKSLVISTPQTPSASTDYGFKGQIAWDASYIYVCVAENEWKRTAISTW